MSRRPWKKRSKLIYILILKKHGYLSLSSTWSSSSSYWCKIVKSFNNPPLPNNPIVRSLYYSFYHKHFQIGTGPTKCNSAKNIFTSSPCPRKSCKKEGGVLCRIHSLQEKRGSFIQNSLVIPAMKILEVYNYQEKLKKKRGTFIQNSSPNKKERGEFHTQLNHGLFL